MEKRRLVTIWKPCQYCKGTGKIKQQLTPAGQKEYKVSNPSMPVDCGHCSGEGISSEILGFFRGKKTQKIVEVDKYDLAEVIRVSFLMHGRNSLVSIATDVKDKLKI